MALIHATLIVMISFLNPMSIAVKGKNIYLTEAGLYGTPDGRILWSKDEVSWEPYAIGLFDPKGIAVYDDSTLVIVDKNSLWIATNHRVMPLIPPSDMPNAFIRDVAVGPDGKIYTADIRSGKIFVVNINHNIETTIPIPKASCVTVADDSTIYVATHDDPGMVVKIKDGKPSLILNSHMVAEASSIVYDPNGIALYLVSRSTGKLVRIDLLTRKGQVIGSFEAPGDMSLSPDGKYLLVPLTKSGGIKKIPIR